MTYKVPQHIYITAISLIFLIYCYIFGDHDHSVKFLISMGIVMMAYKMFTYNENFMKANKRENDVFSDFQEMKQVLLIDEKTKWLEYNPELVRIIQSMSKVINYDKEILRDVIIDLNTFLKTYYIALDKDDPLLYGNITDNQQVIQQMEDLFTQIIDNMKKLIFILKINQYHHELDIPAKINIIYNFLYEKIVLLAHKFKIKLSTERSL